jgi:sec-independent protein translocase protein TatC
MAFPDEPKGAATPEGQAAPSEGAASAENLTPHSGTSPVSGESHAEASLDSAPAQAVQGVVLTEPEPYAGYQHADYGSDGQDPNGLAPNSLAGTAVTLTPTPATGSGAPPKPPKPPEPPDEPDEEDGMARMSFLEHLEELRSRLIWSIGGIGVAFILCLGFSDQLWNVVFGPAGAALRALGVNPPTLKLISPTDTFQILWMKVPILFSIFLSSPWVLYQVWKFISPGLYKHEKRYAVPFVVSSAGLFVLGGLFAYFVAFRYGLEFLLGLGMGKGIDPSVNVNEYYDLFVDVMLGVGIIFEIPIILFLLTLLRIVSPSFLVQHSRYAILAIVFLAAVITPTGDAFNLALFATPMILLFYVGIFAGYLLVLRREKRSFPWAVVVRWSGLVLIVLAAIAALVAMYYGYRFSPRWPFFVR